MKFYEALLLGLVQGLGEFLPVSSSGHLVLLREIMGIEGDFMLFDIMLHVATLLAVFIVFFKDIIALFKPPFKTIGFIILASVPAVITGLIYKLVGVEIFESAKYICFFFLFSAIIMFFAEFISKRIERSRADGLGGETAVSAGAENVNLKTALCMGLMQSVAIFPGITRSGSTIFGGLAAKGDRNSVAKFSFFMSIPVILGAAFLEILSAAKDGFGAVAAVPWYCYLTGMAVAFLSGLFAIKFMMRLISKANFKWFSLYLAILSIVTFAVYFI